MPKHRKKNKMRIYRKTFAAIDCYTCGTSVDPQIAIDSIISVLKPERIYIKNLIRGIGDLITDD